jgi:hypothetical protein
VRAPEKKLARRLHQEKGKRESEYLQYRMLECEYLQCGMLECEYLQCGMLESL